MIIHNVLKLLFYILFPVVTDGVTFVFPIKGERLEDKTKYKR